MIEDSKKENGYIKSDVKILQDAALVIALLSAIGYYLAFSFEKGYRDFYGIEDISFTNIDITSIINSIYKIIPIVLYISIAYLVTRLIIWLIIPLLKKGLEFINKSFLNIFKKFESTSRVHLVLKFINRVGTNNIDIMWNAIRIYIPFLTVLLVAKDVLGDNNLIFSYFLGLFLLVAWIIFPILVKMTVKIKNQDIDNIKFNNPITFIWTNSNLNTKITLSVLTIIGFGYLFYQFGYTDAEQQEDYFVLVIDSQQAGIILDKNDTTMLVCPINEHNQIAERRFQFIPIKRDQDKNTDMKIKKITLVGGLKVTENPRQRQLEKIMDQSKKGILSFFN